MLDADWLDRLVATSTKRTIGGIHAVRYALGDRPEDHQGEVWWAAEHALPMAFTIANGVETTRLSVERMKAGADPTLLRPPALRFPGYAVVQFADWLEHR